MRIINFIVCLAVIGGCKNKEHDAAVMKPESTMTIADNTQNHVQAGDNDIKDISKQEVESLEFKSKFLEIVEEKGIQLDIKYATKDNFTKQKIYDCPKCYLRPEVKRKLMDANRYLQEKYRYSLKIFDCYRPKPYQQRLWDVVPNPSYVTPPHKGSMHSRGSAVDLTIIDSLGHELDMGTAYDFFGKEAHFDYKDHDAKVLKNRALLRKVMENYGFEGIRTEWWHFSFGSGSYNLEGDLWSCP